MLHHSKALGLEIIDCEYHHDPTSSCEIIPSQISNLKFHINQQMTHHSKALELEIADSENQFDPTSSCESIPSQTSNP